MSKPVFTWLPDLAAQQTVTPTVVATKFGDGYEQRTTNGINSAPKVWKLTFTNNKNNAMSALDFLQERGARESFTWTDPFNKTGTYVCRTWDGSQSQFGIYTITASFEQVWEA